LSANINETIAAGERFYDFTVGDLDPAVFPIPGELKRAMSGAFMSMEAGPE
jgi:aspartate aminotransferase